MNYCLYYRQELEKSFDKGEIEEMLAEKKKAPGSSEKNTGVQNDNAQQQKEKLTEEIGIQTEVFETIEFGVEANLTELLDKNKIEKVNAVEVKREQLAGQVPQQEQIKKRKSPKQMYVSYQYNNIERINIKMKQVKF